MLSHFSRVWIFATPWTPIRQAPLSMDSPGKKNGVGCHALLQGIFLTQASKLHLHKGMHSFRICILFFTYICIYILPIKVYWNALWFNWKTVSVGITWIIFWWAVKSLLYNIIYCYITIPKLCSLKQQMSSHMVSAGEKARGELAG